MTSQPIVLYSRIITIFTYYNQYDQLISIELADNSKDTIKTTISNILNIPKKYIAIKKNTAISDEYSRQLEFKLIYRENKP